MMISKFLNGWGKSLKKKTFPSGNYIGIKFIFHTLKFFRRPPCPFISIQYMAAFVFQPQSSVVATGTLQIIKPKIFTTWPFAKMYDDPWTK